MKDLHEMTAEELDAYWKRHKEYQRQRNNIASMLDGCKCRLCISDDIAEIYRMYYHATQYCADLLRLRLKELSEGGQKE